jgi:hypothetical protein
VLTVIARLADVVGTANRDYIRWATSGLIYLALLSSLELIEQLLKRVGVGAASVGAATKAADATAT